MCVCVIDIFAPVLLKLCHPSFVQSSQVYLTINLILYIYNIHCGDIVDDMDLYREVVCHHHLTQVQNWKIHSLYFCLSHFLFTLFHIVSQQEFYTSSRTSKIRFCTAHSNLHCNLYRSAPTCLGRANAIFCQSSACLKQGQPPTLYS